MNIDEVARCLSELGNTVRLEIFRLLVRAGDEGLSISEIRNAIGIPASTLGFHLRGLVEAGLVLQERRGREVRCRANYPRLRGAIDFVMEECCKGAAVVQEL
ncbi:MAG TPA: metalloregulator ArsR/SmtB family transcription factor [Noviherbaspirillum sp.]|nr:metalloregulator ArsR/SmtB family transcription factor [Noviherbaspirillum sp.]